jgi:hypothetical protein
MFPNKKQAVSRFSFHTTNCHTPCEQRTKLIENRFERKAEKWAGSEQTSTVCSFQFEIKIKTIFIASQQTPRPGAHLGFFLLRLFIRVAIVFRFKVLREPKSIWMISKTFPSNLVHQFVISKARSLNGQSIRKCFDLQKMFFCNQRLLNSM